MGRPHGSPGFFPLSIDCEASAPEKGGKAEFHRRSLFEFECKRAPLTRPGNRRFGKQGRFPCGSQEGLSWDLGQSQHTHAKLKDQAAHGCFRSPYQESAWRSLISTRKPRSGAGTDFLPGPRQATLAFRRAVSVQMAVLLGKRVEGPVKSRPLWPWSGQATVRSPGATAPDPGVMLQGPGPKPGAKARRESQARATARPPGERRGRRDARPLPACRRWPTRRPDTAASEDDVPRRVARAAVHPGCPSCNPGW